MILDHSSSHNNRKDSITILKQMTFITIIMAMSRAPAMLPFLKIFTQSEIVMELIIKLLKKAIQECKQ